MNTVKRVRLAVVFELHKEMISQHFNKDLKCFLIGGGVWWLYRSVTEHCEGSSCTDFQNVGEIFIHVHMARVYKLILCIKCQLQDVRIRMAFLRLFGQSAFLLLKSSQLVCELFSALFPVYCIPVLCCVVPCRLFICRLSTNDLCHSARYTTQTCRH